MQIEPGVVPATRGDSSRAHDVVGEDLRGRPAHVEVAGAGARPTLLAFLTSGCSVCLTFWQELGPDTDTPGDARLVVVAKGRADESPATLARLARPGVEVVASSGAWADYDIPGLALLRARRGRRRHRRGLGHELAQRARPAPAGRRRERPRAGGRRVAPGPGETRRPCAAAAVGSAAAGGRDDLSRIDAELAAAGIHPGHPSLYEPGRPGRRRRGGRPVTASVVALVIGLPMAVIAAVRATWSP